MVDNWERLDEVANSAQDSEDAGLIQYAKTLDSLESKLANIKTSFQQFYMSVFNGNFFKTAIDLINNFITSLNRVGPLLGSINLLQLISQIKLIGSLLVNVFQKSLSDTSLKINNWKKSFTEGGWTTLGETIGEKLGAGLLKAIKEAGGKIPDVVEEAAVTNAPVTEDVKNQVPATTVLPQQQIAFTQASALRMQMGLLFNKNFDSAGQYFGNIQNIIGKGKKVQGQQNYGYKGAAQAILANKDAYDASAVQWAESVDQSGQKWSDVVKLSTIEEKAAAAEVIMKEMASADAILAKNQAGATQVGSLMNSNFNTASNYIITGAKEFANIVKGAAPDAKQSSDGSLWKRTKERIKNIKAGQWYTGHKQQIGQGAATAGLALTSAGMMMDQSTMSGYDGGTALQAAGGALNAVGQALTGNYVGAIITGITTVSTMFTRISERAKVELENAEKAASEANIKRAEARTEKNDLESTISNLKKLQEARYDSEEAMQAYIDASNAAIEKYPELANTVNATGQQMADVLANTSQAERLLAETRQASAEATYKAAVAERNKIIAEQKINSGAVDYYNKYANTTTAKWWGNQGVLVDLDNIIPGFREVFAHPTNKQAFDLIANLYNPNSEFYEELQQYAKAVDIEFSELQQLMDQQILALFGGDKKITGESSTTAYEALQYHKSLFPQQSILMNQEAASNQAIITSKIDELFTAQRATQLSNSWQDIAWLKKLGTTWAAGDFNYTDTMFDETGLTAYGLTQLSEHINNFANDLDDFYVAHAEDLSNIEQLLQQASQGTVSYSNFQSQLKDFGIDNSSNIYGMFDAAWIQNDIRSRNFYANAIANQMQLENVSFESYENWLGDNQDTFENQQEYRDQLLAQIKSQIADDNEQIGNFIVEASIQQLSQYLSVLKETSAAKKLLDEGDKAKSTEIALSRGKWIQQQLLDAQAQREDTIWEEGILTAEQSQQLLEALLTDIGTYNWSDNITNLITSFGVEFKESWSNIEQFAYENYQIRLQTLIDSASTITESLDGLLEKQEKGFTWEEAQSTLKQLQKLDPNTTWSQIFDTNAQGVITLKDFAATSDKLYQASLKNLQKEKNKNKTIIQQLESADTDQAIQVDTILESFSKDEQQEGKARSLAEGINSAFSLQLDANALDELTSQIASGEINSFEAVLKFYQGIGKQINNATDVIAKQTQTLLASNAFGEYTKTFEKASNFKSLSEASSISDFEDIWTKKAVEHFTKIYSKEEFDALDETAKSAKREALGAKDNEDLKRILTTTGEFTGTTQDYINFYSDQAAAIQGAEFDALGNLEITDAEAYTDYVATLLGITDTTSKEYQQVTANVAMQLEQQREDALNKISDLGAIAASGEDTGAYWEAFDETGMSYEKAETNISDWIRRAATNPEDRQARGNLRRKIKKQIKAEGFTGTSQELTQEVNRRYDELIAGYIDGINENILEYIDLASKSTEGLELTETESLRMQELSDLLGTQLSQNLYSAITDNAIDTIGKYASIINVVTQADLPWGQIEDIVRDSYTNMIDTMVAQMRSGDRTMSADKWATLETISDTAGIFDSGTLAEIFTAAQREGITIKEDEFANAFRWDDTVNGLVVNSAEAVKKLFNDASNEYVDAILKANNEFALQKAIDFNKYQDTLNNLFSNITEITLEDIQSAYDEIHGAGTFAQSGQLGLYQQAIADAEKGNTEMLIEHLRVLATRAHLMGYDVDFSELEAALEDAQISLIDRLVSFLEAGIEGTLSATEHAELKERYKLSEGIQTAQGIQLTREDQQKMFGAIYGQARASGNLQGIEDTLLDILPDGIVPENLSEAIDEAEKAAGGLKNRTEDTASAAWDYYDALIAAQKALMLNEDAYDFTFMEQEPTDGLTANFDNFKDQINSVTDAFEAFKSKEAIDYKDFYNMMDFINEQGQWESFTEKVNKAGLDYEQFVNSVVSNTDEWGKVDIGSVAAELGISVDAAMTAMSESMTDSLTQTAKEQVKYLSGLEAMLEAMAALEGLNTNYGISFDITYKDGDKIKSFEGIQDVIDYYNQLPDDAAKKEFIIEITEKYNASSGVAQQNAAHLLEIFGTDFEITDAEWDTIKSFEKAWDAASPEMRQELQKTLGQITSEQAQWIAENATSTDGTIDFSKLWETLLNPDSIQSSFGAALQQAFAGNNTISIDGQIFEIDTTSLDGNDFIIKGTPGATASEALLTQIDTYLKKNGIRIDRIKQQTYEFDTSGQLTLQVTNFDTNIAEALKSGDWITDQNGNQSQTLTIDGQEVNFVYTVGAKNFTVTAADGKTPLDKEAIKIYFAKLYGLNEEGVTVEGEGTLTVGLDFTQKEDSLATIKTAVETIAEAVETGISFTIDNAEALAAITEIKTAIDAIPPSKDLTVNVKQRTIGAAANVATGIIGVLAGSGQTGASSYTGTVNDLHGFALADGNEKLLAGANLANKTLVGELGPELAVYNGEYHMLGTNGAEFVKLPDDAIVFNHLQTAGILNGQMNVRGQALVNGNISGPALAGGAAEALQAVRRAKSVWQGLIKDLSAADLVGAAGGGGGGGDDTKAHIEDLEEWYNLSRKIANVEQEINNIIAERENIADGHEYLRSLRLQQELLQEQIGYQETLLNYQELQLKRQADIINTDKLWSQFIHVNETGLLQYNKGNETNGGKGALEVLQDLNEMSGKDQIAFLDKIGYKYTTTDGEELEGSDLVAKFFEELQKQIDEYDALYDTVHETNETIENLKTNIEEINQEIIDNQLELETEIYDLIVKAWEKEIEKMEEYADKVEEANQKYVDGLQDALDAERDLYDKNQSIDDRETLQRQLALLRRSGGSASEIADLEAELDNMLKDEYFANQQEAIDNIQKVNEAQLEALQQQIQLEEDSLAFQQEHGLIWNQVNEIMQGGFDSMMNFFTAKDNEFFEASALAQIEKLDDWAKRVGIYDEDQAHQKHEDKAAANYWDNNAIWSDASLAGMQQVFNSMADSDKKAIKDTFLNAYANAKMSGKSEDEAKAAGINSITSALNAEKERQDRAVQQVVSKPAQSVTDTPTPSEPAKPATRYVYMWAGTPDDNGNVSRLKQYGINVTADAKLEDARRIITEYIKRAGYLPSSSTVYGFSEGGLVDYTGPAIVHGTPAHPEGFLNAEQTAQIREALAASGDSTLLNILRSVASQLKVVSGAVSNSVSNSRSVEIAQGAVQVQVGTLANSYDIEDLSNDIMGRIVAIADKSTNRSVGRR